jgi:hypothetical protein
MGAMRVAKLRMNSVGRLAATGVMLLAVPACKVKPKGSVDYSPPFVPIEITVDTNLNIDVHLAHDKSIKTPIGTFKFNVGASVAATKAANYLVLIRHGDTDRYDSYEVPSDKELTLSLANATVNEITFAGNRVARLRVLGGEVIRIDQAASGGGSNGAGSTAGSGTSVTGMACPEAANVDRRSTREPMVIEHEWTDGAVHVLICVGSGGRLYYYGSNRRLVGTGPQGADIFLDAVATGVSYMAINGDSSYEIAGNHLTVRLPAKQLDYDLNLVR